MQEGRKRNNNDKRISRIGEKYLNFQENFLQFEFFILCTSEIWNEIKNMSILLEIEAYFITFFIFVTSAVM